MRIHKLPDGSIIVQFGHNHVCPVCHRPFTDGEFINLSPCPPCQRERQAPAPPSDGEEYIPPRLRPGEARRVAYHQQRRARP